MLILFFSKLLLFLVFMKLRRVEEWTKGKPEIQALASAFLVVNAENIFSLMYHIGSNPEFAELLSIDIDYWESLYHDLMSKCDRLFDAVTNVKSLDPSTYAESAPLLDSLKFAKELKDIDLLLVLDWIRKTLLDNFVFPDSEPKLPRSQLFEGYRVLFQSAHIVFALKILIPCILIYRTTPFVLLRRAMNCDIEALENLLSLDTNLQNIREIRQIWEKKSRYRENLIYSDLVKSQSKPVVKKIKLKGIKIAIATAIEYLFKRTGHPISRNEIRDLFDAYTRDVKKIEIDQDLPDSEDGFSRAINRENKRWKAALETLPQ